MAQTVFILREFNVLGESLSGDPVTVWAGVGNGDDYEKTGIKLAGPVPLVDAERMIEGLQVLLTRLGHQVVVETTADD